MRTERVVRWWRGHAVQRRARLVDYARVEEHDLKPTHAVARVLCEDLAGDLHVDRARTARPARAAKRPFGLAADVQRAGVAIRHAREQMPVALELADADARERSRARERNAVPPALCGGQIHCSTITARLQRALGRSWRRFFCQGCPIVVGLRGRIRTA